MKIHEGFHPNVNYTQVCNSTFSIRSLTLPFRGVVQKYPNYGENSSETP